MKRKGNNYRNGKRKIKRVMILNKFNSKYITRVLEDENNKQEIERNKEEHRRTLHL